MTSKMLSPHKNTHIRCRTIHNFKIKLIGIFRKNKRQSNPTSQPTNDNCNTKRMAMYVQYLWFRLQIADITNVCQNDKHEIAGIHLLYTYVLFFFSFHFCLSNSIFSRSLFSARTFRYFIFKFILRIFKQI